MKTYPKAPTGRPHALGLLPVFAAILAMAPVAWADTTSISSQPLATLPDVSASPNLMFVLDDSGSMAWEHMPDDMNDYTTYGYVSAQCNGTAYDPSIAYYPPLKYDGTSYANSTFTKAPLDGYVSTSSTLNLSSTSASYTAAFNNGTASITNPFYHFYTYKGSQKAMGWTYTTSGVTQTTFYNECLSTMGDSTSPGYQVFTEKLASSLTSSAALADNSNLTTTAQQTNYANWFSYYRKRYLLMRTAVGRAINGLGSNYNVGLNYINAPSGSSGMISNPSAVDGTYFRDVKPFDASAGATSQKAKFYTSLYSVVPGGSTPLRGGLAKAGQYFANKASGQTYDPMQYSCQRNYAVVETDGYWNTESNGTGPYQLDGKTNVGNQDSGEANPMWDGTTVTVTTVTTSTAQATRSKQSSTQTATITWTNKWSLTSKTNTGTTKNPKYAVTNYSQTYTETLTQASTTPEVATASKTHTVVTTNGVAGTPTDSAVSYSTWVDTTPVVWATTDTGAPTASYWTTATITTSSTTTTKAGTGVATTPVVSSGSQSAWSPSFTYTYSTPVVGTFTAGTPVSTTTTSGGSSNSLADVAEYYYKTDLRNSSLSNCSSSSSGSARDVCQDNVPLNAASGDTETFQHVNTFAIGLGVSGTLPYDSTVTPTSGTLVNWPTPCGSTGSSCSGGDATNVDDLWHAAMDGRGQYYSALNATLLSAAINGALTSVAAVTGSGAAAATSSLELVAGDNNQVYKASYTTSAWTGELQAFTLNGDGSTIVTPAVWSAQTLLDSNASRTIYFNSGGTLTAFNYANLKTASLNSYFDNFCSKTPAPSQCTALNAESTTGDVTLANTGSNLVNYLTGTRSYEVKVATASNGVSATNMALYRPRAHVLGDIINGAPVYVGKPPFAYADAGYADFVTAKSSRAAVVYTAANDGMLHAFSASTGAELWAYVPTMVMPNLFRLADASYSTSHQYYVDGAPVMGDAYIGGAWKTILVGGLNDGGQGYYALDITNPTSPVLLWEFTDSNLGLSYGNPVITKRSDGTWVVVFSSGYNNTSGDGNGHLFVVDAAKGTKLLDVATYTSGTTAAGTTTAPSGLAKINAWIDDPTNNTSLRFYGGDLLGNLWRFDIDKLVQPNQGALLLASFEANKIAQPITTRPQTAVVGSTKRPVIVVATGRYLGTGDLSNTDQQSIYAVADNLTATGWGDPRSTANASAFVQQTLTLASSSATTATVSNNSVDFSNSAVGGWYVDLPHSGERVFSNMTLQYNTLVVSSAIPNSDACTSGGSSWLYDLNISNGGVVISNPAGSLFASDALIVGLSWIKDSTGNVHVLVQDSKGNISSVTPQVNDSGSPGALHRTSWRELVN